jgi:hypothetical protein
VYSLMLLLSADSVLNIELRCGYKDILSLQSQHFLLQFSTLTCQLVIAMRCFIAKGTELIASSNIPDITDDNIDAVIDHHVALLANEDRSGQNHLQMHVDLLTHVKEEGLARWGYLKEITERHESRIRERWMKKTIEERRQLLLSVWPHISPWHQFESFTEPLTDIDTTADKKPVPRKTDKASRANSKAPLSRRQRLIRRIQNALLFAKRRRATMLHSMDGDTQCSHKNGVCGRKAARFGMAVHTHNYRLTSWYPVPRTASK